MKRHYWNEDQILIPSKNGYISIPAKGVRQQEKDRKPKSSIAFSLVIMKIKNNLQFAVMVFAMAAIMCFIGYTIGGTLGIIMALIASLMGFFLTSNFSIAQLLKKRNARFIHPYEGGPIYEMLGQLVRKAKLEKMPALFIDNSPEINAFTLEDKESSAIVISRGIINNLTARELNGVLAHEIAHLKNRDVRIMLFSEQLRRLTGYMAIFGQVLLILNLPFLIMSQIVIPWISIILLLTAPMLSLLFQVAISRNREFRADMDAVVLTGDTKGLAQALAKINMQSAFWKKMYAPYVQKVPEILRTHPNTPDRIKRLNEIDRNRDKELSWTS